MEFCARCHISEEKVRLFDAIYDGKAVMLCERCSIIENIPVIKKPDLSKIYEKNSGVESLARVSYEARKEKESRMREQRLRELEKNPELELPVRKQLNLTDHFHWEIMKNRRRKGLSYKQLAEAIGESEIALEMLEKGKLPENPEILIKKIEQFFQISLRKVTYADVLNLRKEKMVKTKPVLLDEYGNELNYIPEPETENIYMEIKDFREEQKEIPWYKRILGRKKKKYSEEKSSSEEGDNLMKDENVHSAVENNDLTLESRPLKSRYLEYRRREQLAMERKRLERESGFQLEEGEDLDLDKIDITRVKVSDLREIHKKRVEVTREEKKAEQKLIKAEKFPEEKAVFDSKIQDKITGRSGDIDKILGGKELFSDK